MIKDAEANAAEDKARREVIELKNHGDTLVHATEKSLSEHGDKISAEEKAAIEVDLNALKEALQTENNDEIQSKLTALTQSSMKMGEAIYKATQEASAASPQASGAPAGETVVDAEFEDLNDDDRKQA